MTKSSKSRRLYAAPCGNRTKRPSGLCTPLYNSDRLFRFERERAKLTDTIKLLEQGLSETQAEVVTLKTSNEEMKNKITDVCGEENLSDIKKTLAGNFDQAVSRVPRTQTCMSADTRVALCLQAQTQTQTWNSGCLIDIDKIFPKLNSHGPSTP